MKQIDMIRTSFNIQLKQNDSNHQFHIHTCCQSGNSRYAKFSFCEDL